MSKHITEKISLLNKAVLEAINETNKITIVKDFTETGLKILNADFGWAWWKTPTRTDYHLAYVSPTTPYTPNLPRKKGGNYIAQKNRQPVFVFDNRKETYSKKFDVTPYMRSYVIIPIAYKKQSYGNIVLCYKRQKYFSKQDASLASALGNAMAQAMTINKLNSTLRDVKYSLDHTLEPVVIFDPITWKISYYNASLQGSFRLPKVIKDRSSVISVIHPSFKKKFINKVKDIVENQTPSSVFEAYAVGPYRSKLPVEVLIQYVQLPRQAPHLLMIIRDISERLKNQKAIRYAAFHDTLTGLPNRFLLSERLHKVLEDSKTRHEDSKFAVLFIDLDRFKVINDIFGHVIGDELLKQVGQRLTGVVRKSDMVTRMGGDEFVIFVSKANTESHVEAVAQHILEVFNEPFNILNNEVFINVSIGGSIYPIDGTDEDSLLIHADNALYKAKQQGGSSYQKYQSDMVLPGIKKLEIEKDLRYAIRNNQLRLVYQPLVDLSSQRVVSVEALVRWDHPELGAVSPSEFIGYAEESGLIVQLGKWVLREACRQLSIWKRQGLGLTVSVNVSPRELLQRDMVGNVLETLREYRLSSKDISFELTETFLVKNMEVSKNILDQFKALGFKIYIDDFGTGYASVNYLKMLPVDYIKIDKSYIAGSIDNKKDAGIIQSLIAMAHFLGERVVAEGVETKQQAEFLKKLTCDFAQGHFFSPPVEPEKITKEFLVPQSKGKIIDATAP